MAPSRRLGERLPCTAQPATARGFDAQRLQDCANPRFGHRGAGNGATESARFPAPSRRHGCGARTGCSGHALPKPVTAPGAVTGSSSFGLRCRAGCRTPQPAREKPVEHAGIGEHHRGGMSPSGRSARTEPSWSAATSPSHRGVPSRGWTPRPVRALPWWLRDPYATPRAPRPRDERRADTRRDRLPNGVPLLMTLADTVAAALPLPIPEG